jgi:hypothetical protein
MLSYEVAEILYCTGATVLYSVQLFCIVSDLCRMTGSLGGNWVPVIKNLDFGYVHGPYCGGT